jgi:acyl-CoA synthetase (AMP-forming)/AMP-acid ligase II
VISPQHVRTLTGRELWRTRVQRSPDRPFVLHEGSQLTFGQADAAMLRLAGGLERAGIGPGTRVLVGMVNGIDTLIVQAALRELGAVLVPLMPGLTFDELAYQVRHSRSTVLIAGEPIASQLLPRLSEFEDIATVVRADELDGLADGEPIDPHRAVDIDVLAPWAIFYTSGSSGRPKGVLLPAGAFPSGGAAYADRFAVDRDDNFLLATTMAHAVGGLTAPCIALYKGCRLTIVDRFSPSTFWPAVQTSAATVTILFPAHLNLLLETQSGAPAPGATSMRLMITHAWVEAFRERFGIELALCWGMTETGAGCTGSLPGYRGPEDGYVGPAMDGFELAIKDGEICVRNPYRMLEYLDDPQATAATVIDGWLHSGDRGEIDPNGGVWFQGRIKNMIKRSGENVSPEEIESVLITHEAVSECLVLGVPDPIRTEEVAAVVVLRAGASVTPEELADFTAERLARWKAPRYVRLTEDALPRLGGGKVDRQRARRELDLTTVWDRQIAQPR